MDLFAAHGQDVYAGERVRQLEHVLQSASLAERKGAPANLIAAALLHDVGHLLDARGAGAATHAHTGYADNGPTNATDPSGVELLASSEQTPKEHLAWGKDRPGE